MKILFQPDNFKRAVYLHHLFVLPEYRPRGLGRWNAWAILADAILADMSARGFRRAVAGIFPWNERALSLHLRRGWRVIRETGTFSWRRFSRTRDRCGSQGRLFSILPFLFMRLRNNRITRRLAAVFPRAWLLEGPSRRDGRPARVLFFGDPHAFRYTALRVFRDLPEFRPLGRTAVWRWKSLMARHGIDLFWGEMTEGMARRRARAVGFCVPEFVESVSDGFNSRPGDTSFHRLSVARRLRSVVRENGWTLHASRDPDDFYRFYHFYYLPTVHKKFSQYRFVMPERAMREIFDHGFLLQLREGSEVLGQILVEDRGRSMALAYWGVRSGSDQLAARGILAGCYYMSFLYARDHKKEFVDLGRARPFFDDGVFFHKRQWGTRFHYDPGASRCYWMVPNLAGDAARQFLLDNAFLAHTDGGLEGIYHYDPLRLSRKSWIAHCRKNFGVHGALRPRYLPMPPLFSPVPGGFLLPPVPRMSWRSITGGALRLLSALKNRIKGRDYATEYARTCRISPADLRDLQFRKLLKVLRHARAHVPHYRDALSGVPADGFAWEHFRKLPLMDRRDLADNLEKYHSTHRFRAETKITTSGTTSAPVAFYVDLESIKRREIIRWRGRTEWGLRRGDAHGKFWGRYSPPKFKKLLKDHWLENAIVYNGYNLTPAAVEQAFGDLLASPARYVYAYSAVIFEIATRWRERGWAIPPGQLAAVYTTADMISTDQEQVVEAVFGAPVVREYGCSEFLEIAIECPHGGYHMNADQLIIEFLKEDNKPARPGEQGRIVITDLENLATPFIRYPVGDTGSYTDEPCPCGSSLPLLKELWGRENVWIDLPDGVRVHPGFCSKVMETSYEKVGLPCLPWHITQKALDVLEVTLTERVRQPLLEETIQRTISYLHPALRATFRYVDVLPWTPNGKRARFTSDLAAPSPPEPPPRADPPSAKNP